MPQSPEPADGAWLCNGRLYLTQSLYEQLLAGCPAVALLVRDAQWLLIPLLGGAGGLQVKLRNARGDRVIEAQEFFRNQGFEDSPEIRPVVLRDDHEHGAVRIELK